MHEPAVLTPGTVAAEVTRLCGELRELRVDGHVSTRDAAELAGIPQATLWRMESARHPPTFLRVLCVAFAVGATVDLDDGRGRAPVTVKAVFAPPGYIPRKAEDPPPKVLADPWKSQLVGELMPTGRVRVGAELWWGRMTEFGRPLEAESACRLLDMSHHTLTDIEFGPGWPSLTSVVRVAGLTGRRVVLNRGVNTWRTPPWVAAVREADPVKDRSDAVAHRCRRPNCQWRPGTGSPTSL